MGAADTEAFEISFFMGNRSVEITTSVPAQRVNAGHTNGEGDDTMKIQVPDCYSISTAPVTRLPKDLPLLQNVTLKCSENLRGLI